MTESDNYRGNSVARRESKNAGEQERRDKLRRNWRIVAYVSHYASSVRDAVKSPDETHQRQIV